MTLFDVLWSWALEAIRVLRNQRDHYRSLCDDRLATIDRLNYELKVAETKYRNARTAKETWLKVAQSQQAAALAVQVDHDHELALSMNAGWEVNKSILSCERTRKERRHQLKLRLRALADGVSYALTIAGDQPLHGGESRDRLNTVKVSLEREWRNL
ncbi:MAG: hypothetical protein ACYTFQ_24015 [Planctomycetota bacterium]|jgi:hypothetical protein